MNRSLSGFVFALCALTLLAAPLAAEDGVTASAKPSAESQLSDTQRQELLDIMGSTTKRMLHIVAALDDEAWAYKPNPDRWSVGQVVEHLYLAEKSLSGLVNGSLETDIRDDWAEATAGKAEGIRSNVPDRSQKFQAPEPLVPTGEMSRREAVEGFLEARKATMELVRGSAAPLHAHTFDTSALGTLSAYQGLLLISLHHERHLRQIEDVLADSGFPE
jgi:hypothetical protein